jgi:hypothetical protein
MNTEQRNPLMARVRLPGETFTLPSGALFYTDGELDDSVQNGEIHVYPMTTIDEIVLKTPDMLFSGAAITEIFGRCIPTVKKPLDLLAKDVDFLLICLRKVSLGDELEMAYIHNCENAEEHSYIINISNMIQTTKRIDPTSLNKYTFQLENEQSVTLRPARFKEYIRTMQLQDRDKLTPVELKDITLESLAGIISKVDEIEDPIMIREWLEEISPGMFREISDQIEKTTQWGPTFQSSVVCRDCEKDMPITIPANPISFFT